MLRTGLRWLSRTKTRQVQSVTKLYRITPTLLLKPLSGLSPNRTFGIRWQSSRSGEPIQEDSAEISTQPEESDLIKELEDPVVAHNSKGDWKLPELAEDGSVLDSHQEHIRRTGKKLGMFLDGRPRVPVTWRRDKSLEPWQRQQYALREKFYGAKWDPQKKLSRKAMEGIKRLKAFQPSLSVAVIAKEFKVSPEAIRRILKSKWQPKEEEVGRIEQRWKNRGERIANIRGEPVKGPSRGQSRGQSQGQRSGPRSAPRRPKEKPTINAISDDFF